MWRNVNNIYLIDGVERPENAYVFSADTYANVELVIDSIKKLLYMNVRRMYLHY